VIVIADLPTNPTRTAEIVVVSYLARMHRTRSSMNGETCRLRDVARIVANTGKHALVNVGGHRARSSRGSAVMEIRFNSVIPVLHWPHLEAWADRLKVMPAFALCPMI